MHNFATDPVRRPRRLAGFTLMEMLVVMMIVALVSGVLFQALERAYRLQERFGSELFKVQQGYMAVDWFRQSVQGLYPDSDDGRNKFSGEEHAFSGLSSSPLGEDFGAPTPVRWALRANTQNGSMELVYTDTKGAETALLRLPGQHARFVYVDDKQQTSSSWPPPLGRWKQLPSQVQLLTDGPEPFGIVSVPMGPKMPAPRTSALFGATP